MEIKPEKNRQIKVEASEVHMVKHINPADAGKTWRHLHPSGSPCGRRHALRGNLRADELPDLTTENVVSTDRALTAIYDESMLMVPPSLLREMDRTTSTQGSSVSYIDNGVSTPQPTNVHTEHTQTSLLSAHNKSESPEPRCEADASPHIDDGVSTTQQTTIQTEHKRSFMLPAHNKLGPMSDPEPTPNSTHVLVEEKPDQAESLVNTTATTPEMDVVTQTHPPSVSTEKSVRPVQRLPPTTYDTDVGIIATSTYDSSTLKMYDKYHTTMR